MAGLGRSFTHLWASAALSNLADGVLKVGAPLLAVSITRSPTEVALVGAAATLPWLVFALPAGAVADRVDRRRVMALANAGRAGGLVAAGALAASGVLNLWLMLLAVLVAGVAEVFADTAAQAVLPMTVPAERLAAANGRVVGAQTVGNDFVGAPLAGVLVTLLPAAVLGGPALLYGAAALLLLGMRGRFRPARPPRADGQGAASMRREIAEALRYLWGHRFLRTLALSAGAINAASAAYFGVLVLWLVGEGSRVGLEPSGYGLMMTALAVGALAGSLVSERITRLLGEGRTLVLMWMVSALLHLVPVLLPVAWLLYPTAVVWGLAGASANVLVISARQRLIPAELLGRVNSAYRLIGMGGMPVGAALGGVLGELAGLPAVFLSATAVSVAAVCLVWRVAPRRISVPLTSDHTVDPTSGSLSAP
ncbi:MFS transporter [Nonomuraea muscovyensis]|uniref:MFS family permease n=1 Tax=Nonomuraea muscovyensis TaxID=1124761 RepID=A0A7X0EW19_9ACTN|nr:MFS transporter [Nonomuraea muscovyensis]MBB6343834.1 MFS family permease [Nonomuraea muscovyensis]